MSPDEYSVSVEVRLLVILDLMVAGGLHGITTTNCEATGIRLHGYGGGKIGMQQEQRAVKSMRMLATSCASVWEHWCSILSTNLVLT